jgi:orotate phosphoribosyltransferase
MRSIDALIDSAEQLTNQGLSQGEVADELNVSRETASWLVSKRAGTAAETDVSGSPTDVHVDWSAIGRDSTRLAHLGAMMADLLAGEGEDVDLTVGVGKSGAPLATVVGGELATDFAVYMPGKYQWNDDDTDAVPGSFSQNFAGVEDRDCYLVDDNIDTGQTMTETIERVREHGGTPRGAVVLTDKLGEGEIRGVPVHSLVKMVQMGED